MIALAEPEFVTHVMRHPRVWRWVSEDGMSPEEWAYQPNGVYYRHPHGFMLFCDVTKWMQQIHIAMLPGAKDVQPFVMQCLASMAKRGVRKFVAPIGEWNRAALRLARICGFEQEGYLKQAFWRNNQPYGCIYMGKSWDS